MFILAGKNENAPKNAKNNNLLKTKRILNIKILAKGARFFDLVCQGGGSTPFPPLVTPLGTTKFGGTAPECLPLLRA